MAKILAIFAFHYLQNKVWQADALDVMRVLADVFGIECWGTIQTKKGNNMNYVIYHLHSDLSNGVTNVDSVTGYRDYVTRARECGMTALGFSEHGSVFEWYHKKTAIEQAGMKYLHGVECYVTAAPEEKIRDNMHCVLIARNHAGFLELNRLVTRSFERDHFYYVPRITLAELFATSGNILITSACVGGILGKGGEEVQRSFLTFMAGNAERCFLEIGHHPDPKQVAYNQRLLTLAGEYGLRLIAGTDTHALNEEHEHGRSILQRAKNIRFDGEDGWDLRFKTYDELVEAYRRQDALPETAYLEAIENTNVLAAMVEPFTVDTSTKYPHIYDRPEEVFREKIEQAIDRHPYALQNHTREELTRAADGEFEVFRKTGSIDFMLMQAYLREWEQAHGIRCGYGRGSVSGSMVAYLLGITQMDSLRFHLNFFRFANPDRVTNADIDTDYAGRDRERVKRFLLEERMGLPNIRAAEIITFNTIALRGAIRDVVRALYREDERVDYQKLTREIVSLAEADETEARAQYPEVFRYVDLVNGAIVSVGTHPSGVLVSDLPIEETVGLCRLSSSPYPVSMVNMKELDALMYVKLDILGLDNIGVINDTCDMLGIERLTPDNTDLEDMAVWDSIRRDTTMIFQWESKSAQQYMRRLFSDETLATARSRIPDFSMLKWFSFGNGLLRPACASFRDSVARGEFYDNGFGALNEFLAPEAGRIAMQETIMRFLVEFCGYSDAESDTVRRGIAKKQGTDKLLPEIERRFIERAMETYGLPRERCEEIIRPFLQIILDASDYGFSWNHSDAYSAIGYICGYLRYYHPLEFLTAALNTFGDDREKTSAILAYARKVGIAITPPKFGISRENYRFDRESRTIAQGLASIKYMSANASQELSELAQAREYGEFVTLLKDISDKTSLDARQLDMLIKLDFFSMFGNQRELLRIVELFELFKKGEARRIRRSQLTWEPLEAIVAKYAVGVTKTGPAAKSYTILDNMLILREAEALVKSLGMPDLDDLTKVRNYCDIMGYAGYVSGKEEDRRKLYITEVYPLYRKRDHKRFGYGVATRSIGSGVEARFTIFDRVWERCPLRENDIIYCGGYERDGQYYHLTRYEKIG